MNAEIKKAVQLRTAGRKWESLRFLCRLVERCPRNARAHYQCAWSHDVLGLEKDAIPFYERAIALGLRGKDLAGALIGLGSSYRCVGNTAKAVAILEQACRKFPKNRAAQLILAMALHDSGRPARALGILLRNLGETSVDRTIRQYNQAILSYAKQFEGWASRPAKKEPRFPEAFTTIPQKECNTKAISNQEYLPFKLAGTPLKLRRDSTLDTSGGI